MSSAKSRRARKRSFNSQQTLRVEAQIGMSLPGVVTGGGLFAR